MIYVYTARTACCPFSEYTRSKTTNEVNKFGQYTYSKEKKY